MNGWLSEYSRIDWIHVTNWSRQAVKGRSTYFNARFFIPRPRVFVHRPSHEENPSHHMYTYDLFTWKPFVTKGKLVGQSHHFPLKNIVLKEINEINKRDKGNNENTVFNHIYILVWFLKGRDNLVKERQFGGAWRLRLILNGAEFLWQVYSAPNMHVLTGCLFILLTVDVGQCSCRDDPAFDKNEM